MLTFNQRGLLIPNYNLPSSLDELEAVFIQQIGTPERQRLFEGYLTYLTSLRDTLPGGPFVQWVDGSFTTHEPRPRDVDVVNFISFDVVERCHEKLQFLKYLDSVQRFGVDGYVVSVFPPDHRLYALYVSDRAYWMDKFDKTERNRRGIIHPKGFLELTFLPKES